MNRFNCKVNINLKDDIPFFLNLLIKKYADMMKKNKSLNLSKINV